MLLGEPGRTDYDLRFPFLGIPVRVHPLFWLVALIIGARSFGSDGRGVLIFMASMFVSILIHEMGHALAFRRYGIGSHVVLYHFGGLAVPDSYSAMVGFGKGLNPKNQIFISFAGPGAQFLIVGAIILGFAISNTPLPMIPALFPVELIPENIRPVAGYWNPSDSRFLLIVCLLQINWFWALLNLVPVFPLDGGQIARELFVLNSGANAIQKSLMLSVCCAAGLVIYGFATQNQFMGFLFLMLGIQSYMMLQQMGGGGGYGRRGW